jgi:DNA-binding CsgD family transcriptional regulator
LAPSKYTFKVESINSYGQKSSVASYSFKIVPPWFLTIYAKFIYFILSIFTLSALVTFVYKREQKKRAKMEIRQKDELVQKEKEFRMETEKSENEIIKLRNEKLEIDVSHKNSQLASSTMHLVQKSEILVKISEDLKKLGSEIPPEWRRRITQISRKIEEDIQLDDNWDQFELYFDQVHENFFKRLRQTYPELTPKDQKLCAYLRMNLSTKEVAPLLNISVRGVEISRYRLRKKLNLDSNENLVSHIMEI